MKHSCSLLHYFNVVVAYVAFTVVFVASISTGVSIAAVGPASALAHVDCYG